MCEYSYTRYIKINTENRYLVHKPNQRFRFKVIEDKRVPEYYNINKTCRVTRRAISAYSYGV